MKCCLKCDYLVSSQLDSYCDIDGVVDHTHHWSDQWNEEKGKPDYADQEEDDESSHAIFHYLLFLLPFRLWVFLLEKICIIIIIIVSWNIDKSNKRERVRSSENHKWQGVEPLLCWFDSNQLFQMRMRPVGLLLEVFHPVLSSSSKILLRTRMFGVCCCHVPATDKQWYAVWGLISHPGGSDCHAGCHLLITHSHNEGSVSCLRTTEKSAEYYVTMMLTFDLLELKCHKLISIHTLNLCLIGHALTPGHQIKSMNLWVQINVFDIFEEFSSMFSWDIAFIRIGWGKLNNLQCREYHVIY